MKLRNNKRLTIEEQISVITDYSAGMLIKDIEAKYGISRGSIYHLVNKEIEREAN